MLRSEGWDGKSGKSFKTKVKCLKSRVALHLLWTGGCTAAADRTRSHGDTDTPCARDAAPPSPPALTSCRYTVGCCTSPVAGSPCRRGGAVTPRCCPVWPRRVSAPHRRAAPPPQEADTPKSQWPKVRNMKKKNAPAVDLKDFFFKEALHRRELKKQLRAIWIFSKLDVAFDLAEAKETKDLTSPTSRSMHMGVTMKWKRLALQMIIRVDLEKF
uniref:Uncharacterized protein n=1 Tax=Oryza punctata TaxID=4537 RepID=A0A0E0LJW7_ORYPU